MTEKTAKQHKKKPGHEPTDEEMYHANLTIIRNYQEKERKKSPPAPIQKAFKAVQEYENNMYRRDAAGFRKWIGEQDDLSIGILYHLCMRNGLIKQEAPPPVETGGRAGAKTKAGLILPGQEIGK